MKAGLSLHPLEFMELFCIKKNNQKLKGGDRLV